jgi:hypothetical protein
LFEGLQRCSPVENPGFEFLRGQFIIDAIFSGVGPVCPFLRISLEGLRAGRVQAAAGGCLFVEAEAIESVCEGRNAMHSVDCTLLVDTDALIKENAAQCAF